MSSSFYGIRGAFASTRLPQALCASSLCVDASLRRAARLFAFFAASRTFAVTGSISKRIRARTSSRASRCDAIAASSASRVDSNSRRTNCATDTSAFMSLETRSRSFSSRRIKFFASFKTSAARSRSALCFRRRARLYTPPPSSADARASGGVVALVRDGAPLEFQLDRLCGQGVARAVRDAKRALRLSEARLCRFFAAARDGERGFVTVAFRDARRLFLRQRVARFFVRRLERDFDEQRLDVLCFRTLELVTRSGELCVSVRNERCQRRVRRSRRRARPRDDVRVAPRFSVSIAARSSAASRFASRCVSARDFMSRASRAAEHASSFADDDAAAAALRASFAACSNRVRSSNVSRSEASRGARA